MPRLRALRHLQRHSETSPTRRTAGAQPFLDSPTKSHRATGTPCASWRALLVLALLEVVVVFGWVSLSSIPSEATAFFGISTSELDLTLNWGPAVNLIFAYPASQYLDRSGVRAAALTAGRLAMVSAGLRALPCILGASFRSSGWCLPMLHLGSALFAGPIINTVPTLFSSLYFTDEWRGTATAIVANSAAMGGAASFFAGSFVRRPSDVPAYMYMQLGLSALALLGASFALGDPPFAPQRTTGGEGTRVDGEGTSTSLDGEGAPIEGVSILDGEGMPIGGERTSTPIEGMPIEGMPEGTPAEGRAAAGGDERPPEPHGAVSLAVGERSTSAQAAGATAAEGAEAATARQLFGRQGSFRRACPSRALALTMLGAGTLVGLNGGFAGVLPQAIGTMPGLHANPQGDQADLAMTLSNIVIGAATGPLLDRCFTTAASKARFMAAQALLMVAAYALFALEVPTPLIFGRDTPPISAGLGAVVLELTLIGGLVGMLLPTALEYLVQISPAHLSESASAAGLSSVTNVGSIIYLVLAAGVPAQLLPAAVLGGSALCTLPLCLVPCLSSRRGSEHRGEGTARR